MSKKRWKSSFISLLVVAMAAGTATSAYAATGGIKDVTSFAGSGQFGADGGSADTASFRTPFGIALLKDGSLLISDQANHLIRSAKGNQVLTYAGITFDVDNRNLPIGGLVDGIKSEAIFQSPADLTSDAAGNIYVADAGNNVIRKIDTQGNVTTLAGDPDGVVGSDDGQGVKAKFNYPVDVVTAANGTLYVADTLNHAIRKITPNGNVSTLNAVSTRAVEVFDGQVEFSGDFKDGKLSEALFNEPSGLALDSKGNLYVSDSGNQRIRYIDLAAGTVTTVAGANELAEENALYVAGDYVDGAAENARFDFPKGLAVTPEGGLLIADSSNNAIRYLLGGKVSTIVGTVNADFGDADGTEQTARLHHPTDVEVAANGTIYVADAYNNKIRVLADYQLTSAIRKDGMIHVVIGSKEVVFDAKPMNTNDRVMVPVRAIAESLGYEVKIADNKSVVLTSGDTTIELTIGSNKVKRTVATEVTEAAIDAAAFIKSDRTYVPVRFIAEQLGKTVNWNVEYQTVIIR